MKNIKIKPLLREEFDLFAERTRASYLKTIVGEFGEQEENPVSMDGIILSMEHPLSKIYDICIDGESVGGIIVRIDENTNINCLDHIFIDDELQGKGIGFKTWQMIEKMFPETIIWETHTPYYEIRNINFYVNKCGFQIVEFYNPYHPEPDDEDSPGGVMFFRMEKKMK